MIRAGANLDVFATKQGSQGVFCGTAFVIAIIVILLAPSTQLTETPFLQETDTTA